MAKLRLDQVHTFLLLVIVATLLDMNKAAVAVVGSEANLDESKTNKQDVGLQDFDTTGSIDPEEKEEEGEDGQHKMWTPEVAVHLLSLVEKLHVKMAKWEARFGQLESRVLATRDAMEEKVKDLGDQMASSMKDVQSQLSAVELRLETQVLSVEERSARDVASVGDKLSRDVVSFRELVKVEMELLGERVKDKQEGGKVKDKEEGEKVVVKEHNSKDAICTENESGLEITNKITQLKGSIVDEVKQSVEKIAKNCSSGKEDILGLLQNIIGNLGKSHLTCTDIDNRIATKVSAVVVEGVKEEIKSGNRDVLVEMKRMSDLVMNAIIQQRTFMHDIDRHIDSAMSKAISAVDSLEKELGGNLVSQIDRTINGMINTSFVPFHNQLRLGFETLNQRYEEVTSTMRNVYDHLMTTELTVESCKKDMKAIETPALYPYPVAYSEKGSKREKSFLCDTATAKGGWLILQRRTSGLVDFYLGWEEYKTGFGDLSTDFWMGLETMHRLTASAHYELRVELEFKGKKAFAEYSKFSVGNETDNYRLSLGAYTGNAGDDLTYHNNRPFTTKDRDNDVNDSGNCAEDWQGAWWYGGCLLSNLNGKWLETGSKGPVWSKLTSSDPATFTEMKIRRVF